MKSKLSASMAFLTVLILGIHSIPANAQEEPEENPLLIIKIPDIERLLNDAQALMPPAEGANSSSQLATVGMMLFGTAWIDPGRSLVAGMFAGNDKSSMIALIPFRTPNETFQNAYHAVPGKDYYVISLPPQSEFSASPEQITSLIEASGKPAEGSLVLEASAAKLVAMVEPTLTASLDEAEEIQSANKSASPGLSPQETRAILEDILNLYRQADLLRMGLDLSGDIFTLHMDVEAAPGTQLAGVFTDPGGSNLLMNFPVDMPIQFNARSHDMTPIMDLYKSVLGSLYRQLGINLDELAPMTESFTGETAGGMSFNSDGIAIKMIAALKPGTNGEAFLRDTYLPWMERYSDSMAKLASREKNPEIVLLYERMEDSRVAGTNVYGIKTRFQAQKESDAKMLENLGIKTRIAAVNDMMFMAPDDTGIADLIRRSRNLVSAPAQGPMGRLVIDTTALLSGIKTMMPPDKVPAAWPTGIGDITTEIWMQNGALKTQTHFSAAELKKIVASVSAGLAAAKQAPVPANDKGP